VDLKSIHWLHHASFRIETEKEVIYFDPWKIKNEVKADYIFVSHNHFDHFSIADIDIISKKTTVIICPQEVAVELKGYNFRQVKSGDKFQLDNLMVEVVPAYNINKNFHPKNSGKVGYIVEIDGSRIYHAGDTDFVPEMKDFKNINFALIPIGGTYTMGPEEAAEFVNTVKPDITIPMHYGELSPGKKELEEFKKLVKEKIEVLEKEE
jgi:L-ascorbate metabolism protein UlaG (beta-lactamase superfamily)